MSIIIIITIIIYKIIQTLGFEINIGKQKIVFKKKIDCPPKKEFFCVPKIYTKIIRRIENVAFHSYPLFLFLKKELKSF